MNYYDNPDRMPPDHVLAQAARETNDYATEHGLPATLKYVEIDATPKQVAYLAEQRAIRAMAARGGHNMGLDPVKDEEVARAIISSPEWEQMRAILIPAYMDGFTIGMRAQMIQVERGLAAFILPEGDRRAQ